MTPEINFIKSWHFNIISRALRWQMCGHKKKAAATSYERRFILWENHAALKIFAVIVER